MMRTCLSFALLVMLGACDETSLMGRELPGLGDMYAPSKEEKAEAKWWDDFYGRKPAQTTDIYGNKVSAE